MIFTAYCFYDNPHKWQRELWLDGKLFGVWNWRIADEQDGQPWKPGEIVGDADAMPSRCYTCGDPEPTGDGRCWECVQAAQENEP